MRLVKWVSILLVIVMVFGVAACEQEGPAEQAGEEVDEAVDEAGDELEEAGEAIEEGAEKAGD